jgi:tetratricopeptide (TPR) repeat protein
MNIYKKPAQEAKENFGRAKAFLNKQEVLKGVASTCEGLKVFLRSKLFGTEKIEVEYQIAEVIHMIKTHPHLSSYLPEGFAYHKGSEKQLYNSLVAAVQSMAEALQQESGESEEEDPEVAKRRLLEKMQQSLQSNDRMKASQQLKKIVQEHGGSPGVYSEIADNFYRAGQPKEAVQFARKALERDPKDMTAYRVAVNAFRSLKQYDKAESFYHKALEAFGEHANIYLNLARLYREWGKRDKAAAAAQQALSLDEACQEAKVLLQEMQNEGEQG